MIEQKESPLSENEDSFICGAEAIAHELGLTPKQIYSLSYLRNLGKSDFPVWTERGLGLVTTKAKVRDYISTRLSPPTSQKNKQDQGARTR